MYLTCVSSKLCEFIYVDSFPQYDDDDDGADNDEDDGDDNGVCLSP